MKRYLKVIRIGLLDLFEYRVDLALNLVKYPLTMTIFAMILLYGKSTQESYSIINYYVAATLLHSFSVFHTSYIEEDIKLGGLSKFLLKPIKAFWYYISFQSSVAMAETVLKTIVVIGLLSFFPQVIRFGDSYSIMLAAAFVPLIFYSAYTLWFNISSWAFWFTEIYTIRWSVVPLFRLLSGAYLPLSLFSDTSQHLLAYLPFMYWIHVPAQVLIGNFSSSQAYQGLATLGLWCVGLTVVRNFVWKAGLAHYEATGQ